VPIVSLHGTVRTGGGDAIADATASASTVRAPTPLLPLGVAFSVRGA
jgi:hypothetical protein